MDNSAPVVRYAHEGVTGYWTNDAGTLTVNITGQNTLRVGASGQDTAAHDTAGNQWTDAYGEALAIPTSFGTSTRRIGVWLRVADASNCYTVQADGTGTMTVSKVVAGVATSLGTASFTVGSVAADVYTTMRAEIQGDRIRAYWRGQHVITVQDSTYTGPGFVSLYMRVLTTAGEVQVVRWEAGPLRPNYAAAYTPMAGPLRTGRRLR